MERHSERHQLAVRKRRAVLVAAVVACALAACVVVLSGRGQTGGPLPATRTGATGEERLGTSPGEAIGGELVSLSGDAAASEADIGLAAAANGVQEAATELVCQYEQRGDCVLVRSGYLDLSGRVWSMVVEGSGWVDVCIVQSAGSGTSETKVMHMDAAEWGESLGELGLGG